MKRILQNKKVYREALINPQLSEKTNIRVRVKQGGKGPIPHVYVYRNAKELESESSVVQLNAAKYSEHHKSKNKPLPPEVKEKFIETMENL